MQNEANQILNSGGVEGASQIIAAFVRRVRAREGKNAVYSVSRQCRVEPTIIKRFLQPSRKPKSVRLDIWQKIVAGYQRYLERQLADLQAEAERIRNVGTADHRAVQALLDQAENIVEDIRRML